MGMMDTGSPTLDVTFIAIVQKWLISIIFELQQLLLPSPTLGEDRLNTKVVLVVCYLNNNMYLNLNFFYNVKTQHCSKKGNIEWLFLYVFFVRCMKCMDMML